MNEKNNILFSIIIPTYNRGYMIYDSIKSVINQKYTNWELIVIDDGSIDNTSEIVSAFVDKRIKYFYQENKGRSEARNFGIEKSSGAYLSFLDDDDYYYSDFLSEFYREISSKNNPVCVFMCDQDEESEEGKIDKAVIKKYNQDYPGKFILKYSNNFQPFCTSRDILLKEKFDVRFELGEDFHLMLRLVLKYPFHYFSKTLCVYKIHPEMTMQNELNDNLFLENKYNRIDALEDLDSKLVLLIEKYDLRQDFNKRFNKVAYFYSSKAMKTCWFKASLRYLFKMRRSKQSFEFFYYYLSISFRSIFYLIKCKFF
jgi:glycosyltransferase involved in cell wall biosynthesis